MNRREFLYTAAFCWQLSSGTSRSVLLGTDRKLPAGPSHAEPAELRADVCVVGCGSGGFGAALGAARAGAEVIIVEKQPRLGGTSVNAYVPIWQPGPADSFASELYQRLRNKKAAAITSDHNPHRALGPFGLWLTTANAKYEHTLHKAGVPRVQQRAVVFDSEAMSQLMAELLHQTGRCRVLRETLFTKVTQVHPSQGRLDCIEVKSAEGQSYRIYARIFIDSTGGAYLCRQVGCPMMLGAEPQSRFGEPSAPEKPERVLNSISLCYRITRHQPPGNEPHLAGLPAGNFPRSAHVSEIPDGDWIVNPLALVPGWTLIELGYQATMELAKRQAWAHWQWLRSHEAFAKFRFHSFAPMLGIRETYRVVGEYVLTEHDVRAGLGKQKHPDIIAFADHSLDFHGRAAARLGNRHLEGPYGIPYRCLVPKGWKNLLVACRGASFSHIAASSCRLSRTMIAIGHAAGVAAAMAARHQGDVQQIDVASLKQQLGIRQ